MVVPKAFSHLARHAIPEVVTHVLVTSMLVAVTTLALERVLDSAAETTCTTCATILILAAWKHLRYR